MDWIIPRLHNLNDHRGGGEDISNSWGACEDGSSPGMVMAGCVNGGVASEGCDIGAIVGGICNAGGGP